MKLDFAGLIDMTEGIEQSDFFANVHSMNLKAIGLDTIESGFTGWISLKAKGSQIDKMTGALLTRDIEVFRGDKKLKINTLAVHSEIENRIHTINLFSDFADIRLSGQFSLKNLPAAIQDFSSKLLPGLVHNSEKPATTEQIDFSIKIKEANKLISLFDENLLLDKGSINGGFNSQKGNLVINANLEDFSITGINFGQFTMTANKSNDSELKIHINSGLSISGSKFKADSLTLESVVTKNFLTYTIRATDKAEDLDLKGKGNLSFDDFDKIDLFFEDLNLHIKGKDWKLRDTTSVLFGNNFQLRPIELFSQNESIQATYISDGTNKKIQVKLNEFDVANINGFMSDKLPEFFGLANGNIDLIPTEGKIQFLSKFNIAYFALNQDTVGTISLESKRENEFQNIVDCKIESGIFNGVTVKGLIGNINKVDALDLILKMPSSDVSIFGQFLPGISKLSGGIGGEINIGGDFSKPVFNGEAFCNNVKLEIDYLRVPYTINAKVNVSSNTIDVMKGSSIKDDKGKTAEIIGSLNHRDFADWSYNVKIEKMNNFHVLATSKNDNDLFYGQAYADGNAHFYGTFDKFNMSIKAKTKKGTQIMMPIGDSEISGPASYISFASKDNDTIDNRQLDVGFLNTLLIDVEVDPETEIQLIFDEQTGDIIKGAGTGRLLMEVSEDGEFTMRGGVKIERGDYQFVAFDGRVNKKFFIERGGTIMWDGDPMQARIDLVTYNIQSASPNPLLGINSNDPGAQNSLSSVKARSEIKIKGNLFSPEISFGFNILDMMEVGISELSSIVQRIQSDYDEVSRQVFSLLVFGSFMTPTFVTSQSGELDLNAGAAFTNSIADLISSQVDAWLSQIDDKWLIDFTLTNVTPDQRADMIFKLGRKFVNNRLVFDVTWGTNQAGQANNSFNLEYLASKDGRFRLKAFSRNQAIYNNASVAPVNTIGIGFFYRKEFNGWREWEKYDTTTSKKQPIDSIKNDSISKTNVDSVGLSYSKQRGIQPIKKIYRSALFPLSSKILFREEELV